MGKTRIWITMVCCLFAVAMLAGAQGKGKPGLWEVTTKRTMAGMQMPQLPPGVQLPPNVAAQMSGAPTTTQVCVTQAMVDRFGGPPPRSRGCTVSKFAPSASGFSATMSCTGQFNGTGTVNMTLTDSDHLKTVVHLAGTSGQGRQIDMTMEQNSVYKGADCGSVQPVPMQGTN